MTHVKLTLFGTTRLKMWILYTSELRSKLSSKLSLQEGKSSDGEAYIKQTRTQHNRHMLNRHSDSHPHWRSNFHSREFNLVKPISLSNFCSRLKFHSQNRGLPTMPTFSPCPTFAPKPQVHFWREGRTMLKLFKVQLLLQSLEPPPPAPT